MLLSSSLLWMLTDLFFIRNGLLWRVIAFALLIDAKDAVDVGGVNICSAANQSRNRLSLWSRKCDNRNRVPFSSQRSFWVSLSWTWTLFLCSFFFTNLILNLTLILFSTFFFVTNFGGDEGAISLSFYYDMTPCPLSVFLTGCCWRWCWREQSGSRSSSARLR